MPYYEQDTFAATTVDGVQLHTNDGLLAPSDVAPLRASYPTEPLKELYDRYLTDGYVFLKGLLPRQDVLDAREAYFKSLEPTGILEPGTTPVEGRFNSSADMADYPGIGAAALDVQPGSNNKAAIFVEAAIKAHTEPWYCGSEKEGIIGLCNHPAIREVVAKMTGWGHDTLTVRRTLLRNNTPGNKAIGVHYDQTFMRYGEPTAVTAWIPIGDISVEGGGLIYLKGGDKIGQRIEEDFTLKAK